MIDGPRPWQGGWDGKWKDPKFTWGICQHPEPHINLDESGFAHSDGGRSSGGWVAFCDECRGVFVDDYSSGERVCCRCGLVDDMPVFDHRQKIEFEHWEKKDKSEKLPYSIKIKEAKHHLRKRRVLVNENSDDYISQNTKDQEIGLRDRRIELIFRSLMGPDRIVDLNFGRYALLRDRYNKMFSRHIEYNDARNSYIRFVRRQNAMIDRFSGRIVSYIISDDDHRQARTQINLASDPLREKYFPGRFIYTGTTRSPIKEFSMSQLDLLNEKQTKKYRKQQVRDMILRPKAPSIISRNFIAYDGKSHKVTIRIEGARISYWDESDPSLETFFLDFAIKHGQLKLPKDPEARRLAIEDFRRKYHNRNGFRRWQYYDAVPYLLELQKEIPNLQISSLHSDL